MFKVLAPNSCKASAECLEAHLNNTMQVDNEVRVNWGYSKFTNPKNTNVLGNSPTSVFNSVHKNVTFEKLKGFTVPQIKSKKEFSDGAVQHVDPDGMAGSGVKLIHSSVDDFNEQYLTTKFISGEEYRVYFAYNKVVGVAKKVKLHDMAHPWIKTPDNGWGYSQIYQEDIDNLFDIFQDGVEEVTKKVGLKYGAVDFILEKDTYFVYILEVNSAPCLFNNELALGFAEAIVENEEIK